MIDAREWLEADGHGGFAMGTVDGIRTRRYHALLCSAVTPPEGRVVLVADLEVYVETASGRFALSSHRYRGDVVHPDGYVRLARFDAAPLPRWEWAIEDGTRVACELVVVHGTPVTHLRWTRLAGYGPAQLGVRPLLAPRDYHATHHENAAFRFDAAVDGERVTWQPYGNLPAIVALANARYVHAPDWYRCEWLAEEQLRGLDCEEDLAAPGTFVFALDRAPACLAFAAGERQLTGSRAVDVVATVVTREHERRASLPALDRAAEQYLAARGSGRTIIAGYPWFCDWGRDTFVSLRGLCLATGRRDVAISILRQWASVVSDGMVPNRFDEHAATPEYNSVDAALWFVIACDATLAAGDVAAADRTLLEQAIAAVVAGYARGTRHRIGADLDGLVACGEPGIQLTWMDAKVGDDVVTPRIGKPVEIQALWINALAIAARRDRRWEELLGRARARFADRFWDESRGQLFDVVDCDHVAGTSDRSCRPNQIFSVGGLPIAILEGVRARAVVDTVERELWTPAGLRSLARGEARYHAHYGGDRSQRDHAYHNGTAWAWLLGPFVEAWVRVRGGTRAVCDEARARFFAPLVAQLQRAGLGHLSEINDAELPWTPRGCPFQAWSLAELLRLDRLVLAVA